MDEAVSRWPLTAEVWVRARVSPCGICVAKNGTGAGFSPSSSVFPCQYQSTAALHAHVPSREWTTGPLLAAVQRQSHPINMKNNMDKFTNYFFELYLSSVDYNYQITMLRLMGLIPSSGIKRWSAQHLFWCVQQTVQRSHQLSLPWIVAGQGQLEHSCLNERTTGTYISYRGISLLPT
jgi:hypothetical protein